MQTITLSLTRALATIKLIDKQIATAISELNPCSFTINGVLDHDYNMNTEQFLSEYNAKLQSIDALKANQATLKEALYKANATTTVTIANKPYTIASALVAKADIPVQEKLIQRLADRLMSTNNRIDKINSDVESKVQQQLSAQGSNAQKSKDYIATTKAAIEALYSPVPVNLSETLAKVQSMRADIEAFKAECDMTLSEANASNTITVSIN